MIKEKLQPNDGFTHSIFWKIATDVFDVFFFYPKQEVDPVGRRSIRVPFHGVAKAPPPWVPMIARHHSFTSKLVRSLVPRRGGVASATL